MSIKVLVFAPPPFTALFEKWWVYKPEHFLSSGLLPSWTEASSLSYKSQKVSQLLLPKIIFGTRSERRYRRYSRNTIDDLLVSKFPCKCTFCWTGKRSPSAALFCAIRMKSSVFFSPLYFQQAELSHAPALFTQDWTHVFCKIELLNDVMSWAARAVRHINPFSWSAGQSSINRLCENVETRTRRRGR